MLKLKTKTEFTAPTDRGTVQTVIRFIIDGLFIDHNNISPKGYYYYSDENGKIIQKMITGNPTLWESVNDAENADVVPLLGSNKNLYTNIIQRLKEFTRLQMIAEEGTNFGTTADDFIEDND